MLVYHPAFDIYHGVFRALLLLENVPNKSMPFDALRIVDLYFLFPYLLADFEFPRGAGRRGRRLAGPKSRFNTLPSPKTFVSQMQGLHMLIAAALAGRGLIQGEALKRGNVERTDAVVSEELLGQSTSEDIELAAYLGSNLATIPLLGKDGLKARSRLMEFRYDPA
ncbi:ABC-three component system middle component 5 [Bradyrhizobium sp. DN5]|uniref:ABC-three component system middle component 5 n=1 Tax=Bradyrhizobium sp. DN5 TaxID=3056950 RepID=UPI003524571E